MPAGIRDLVNSGKKQDDELPNGERRRIRRHSGDLEQWRPHRPARRATQRAANRMRRG